MTDAELALHEAAHAVVGQAVGRRVERMALAADGGTTWVSPPDHRSDAKARREWLLVLAAGAEATRLLAPPDPATAWRL